MNVSYWFAVAARGAMIGAGLAGALLVSTGLIHDLQFFAYSLLFLGIAGIISAVLSLDSHSSSKP